MRYNALTKWALIFILLAAFLLRVNGLTSESLWIDEGYSVALADHSLVDVVRGTVADQHPPLYYLLLHLWQKLGHTVYHIRYLSVLIGMVGVAVTFAAARAFFGRAVGYTVAFWMAISPMHIWYSQEARMYVLLAVMTTLSVYFFWRVMRGLGGLVAYVIISLLALYTHNFAIFVIVLQNLLMALWWLSGMWKGQLVRRWLIAQFAVVLGYGLWIPVVLYQARHHQMRWMHAPRIVDLRHTLGWLLLGSETVQPPALVWAVLIVLCGAWVLWRPGKAWNRIAVMTWWLVPIALVFAISQMYPMFQSKQFLIVLPAMVIFSSAVLVRMPRLAQLALASLLILFNISSLHTMYGDQTKHDWRQVAGYVAEQWEQGDIMYLNPAASMLVLQEYMDGALPHDGYPPGYDITLGGWRGSVATEKMAETVLAPLAGSYRRIWLIEFGPGFWDPDRHLETWLTEHGSTEVDADFRGIRVRVYELAG